MKLPWCIFGFCGRASAEMPINFTLYLVHWQTIGLKFQDFWGGNPILAPQKSLKPKENSHHDSLQHSIFIAEFCFQWICFEKLYLFILNICGPIAILFFSKYLLSEKKNCDKLNNFKNFVKKFSLLVTKLCGDYFCF